MYEVKVVEKRYRSEKLPGEGLNVGSWEWYKASALEEVEYTQAKQWRDDANVTSPVETVT
jgi:hypothetical protein